ncbi:MAG: hypothetical protein RIS20_754 [Bacteroidota bacterium]|jgi:hypothetical protein
MLKSFLSVCTIILISGELNAQISLSVGDFANAGDTVRMSQMQNSNLDFVSTGANHTWDFSSLTASTQSLKDYTPIGFGSFLILATYGPFAGSYAATYFNLTTELPIDQLSAFLPIQISDLSQYTKRSTSAITSIGYSINVQGQGVPFKSDTIETRYSLPLTFGDIHDSRGYTFVDLNPATDIKYIQHRQRHTEVDGWGTITTPLGTFQALRVRHDINEIDSIYQTFFGSGSWIGTPPIDRTEYEWWTNGKKEYLLKVVATNVNGNQNISSIEFQDQYLGLDAGMNELSLSASIYPNPAEDLCFFETQFAVENVAFYNQMGELALNASFNGVQSAYIDIQDLKPGVYFCHLLTNKGTIVRKLTKL